MSFYNTPKWRTLRRQVLALYGDECMGCGKTPEDTGKSSHVDHIVPRSKNVKLELDITNMQVLCEQCNVDLKKCYIVDYRTPAHRNLLEARVGRKVKKVTNEKKFPDKWWKEEPLITKKEAQRKGMQELPPHRTSSATPLLPGSASRSGSWRGKRSAFR